MRLNEFLAKHNITMQFKFVGIEREDGNYHPVTKWLVTLSYDDNSFDLDFFTGSNIKEPTELLVFNSLQSDIHGHLDSNSYECWCDEFCLDSENDSNVKSYNKLKQLASDLENFLRFDEAFDDFLYMDI